MWVILAIVFVFVVVPLYIINRVFWSNVIKMLKG
jgi:hypothetical protein